MKVSRALVPTVAFATVATAAEVVALVWLNHVSTPATKPLPPRRAIQMAVPVSTPPPPAPRPKVEQVEPASSQLAPLAALPSPPMASRPSVQPTALGFDLPSLGTGGLVLTGGSATGGSATGANQELRSTPAPNVGPTRAARPKRRPPPRYPPRAAARRIEGEVVLRVAIDAKGRVTAADVVRASPPGVFDDAAIAAARRYRFEPALENGVPTAVTLEQRILFRVPK